MKAVITSTGNTVSSLFDSRFGRAAWFCVCDTETGMVEFLENTAADSNHGAGTKAAAMMAELSAKRVLSGDFGPKAKELLEKFQIEMTIVPDNGESIQAIIDRLN